MSPTFAPGLELSRQFYTDAVLPALDRHYPGLSHAAGRIGWGSDVLGFDTEMSADHGWGPIVQFFLSDDDAELAEPIDEMLMRELPEEFSGYPVRFPAPDSIAPVRHWVQISTVRRYWQEWLAVDIDQQIRVADWLTIPSQRLGTLTGGAVHHDGIGELTRIREAFARYPDAIRLYLLAAGWQRIGQEEHLMPRAGFVGDELGSSVIGGRLVREVMLLSLLLAGHYPPYAKWFGSAFARLPDIGPLGEVLRRVQLAEFWPERNAAIGEALSLLAHRHNALGLTEPLNTELTDFHERPFRQIAGSENAAVILTAIADPGIRALADRQVLGGIDQLTDSTDLLEASHLRPALTHLYD